MDTCLTSGSESSCTGCVVSLGELCEVLISGSELSLPGFGCASTAGLHQEGQTDFGNMTMPLGLRHRRASAWAMAAI